MMKLVTALLCLAALGACVDAPSDDSVTADPRIATNGLVPTAIHANNLNTKVLTGANIASTPGMEDTSAHQIFTSYLVGCALASGQSVTSNYLGQVLTYPGAIGIAPAWTTRPLTLNEELNVSACVLSRANLFGINITISIRGDAPGLTCTADELANYNVEEAAFYGDVFSSSPVAKHACNGVDQVRVGDTYGDLPNRQCGQPDPNNPGYTLCGFVFDGDCADICSVNGDHYSTCASMGNVETVRLYGTAP
jgi:hypothetical protein